MSTDDHRKSKAQLIDELNELRRCQEKVRETTSEPGSATQASVDSEDLYRSFVENLQGIAYRGDMQFKPLFFHGAVEQITGYSEEDLVSGTLAWDKVVHPDDLHILIEEAPKVRSIPFYSTEREYRIVRKDGQIRWINERIQNQCDETGKPAYVQGILFDITEQKRVEEELRRSEEKYRTLFETMGQGVVYQNVNSDIISANPAVERILGLTLDQIMGRTSYDPRWRAIREDGTDFPGEEHPPMIALKTGKPVKDVMMGIYHPRDDSTYWILVDAVPQFRPGEDKPYQVYTTFTNITELKRVEEALRENEKYLIKAQAIAHIGHWHLDPETLEVVGSDELFNIFSLSREEATLDAFVEVVHPDDREYDLAHIRRGMEHGESWDIEHRLICRDGSEKVVHAIGEAIVDETGKVIQLVGTVQDITERKHVEEAFRMSETLLTETGRMAKIGGWEVDAKTLEVSWTEETYRIHEVPIGHKPPLDEAINFYHPDDRQQLESAIQNAFEHGKPYDMELRFTTAKGKHLWTHSICKPITVDGKTVKLTGTFQDITERKQAEEERENLQAQLNQAQRVESIGRLAGSVAHDLNNLLSPILGYGEMLLDDFDPDDRRREFVDEIIRAGSRARDLVSQLLVFGRKQILEQKPLNLNSVVTGFEKLLLRTIREDIEIEIIQSPDIRNVMGDVGQIELVIMNLAVNAQDAMPDGGRLTIETAPTELDEDYAAAHQDVKPGEYVMLAVSDTGCGMDDETREHLFEPFFSTKGPLGTGLGAATVYGIVKQHGGNIWVYSEPGKGTTIKVYLPASEEALIEEKPGEKTTVVLKGSETILLVEDNEQVRRLAHTMLERQGYTLLVAENGPEALNAVEVYDDPVHLLLTDVVMPGMNGKELFVKIAKKCPGLKVLYMSGYTDNVIAHHGVLDEGVAFIQKPFTAQVLAAKVRDVLEQE